MITKLRCLLLDDELPALSYIKMLCEQLPELEVVKAFNDPNIFLKTIPDLDFNCCILDIQMPGYSGLEIAQHLQGKAIIFTTAFKEYAADAFDMNAVDYLRKPIQKDRFELAISKARTFLANQELNNKKQLILNTDKGKTVLNTRDIAYITASETDSRDKVAYFKNGSRITIKNLSFDVILSSLPKGRFCRINKKDIIAMDTVLHFTADSVKTSINLKDKHLTFPLSEAYREEFRQKLNH